MSTLTDEDLATLRKRLAEITTARRNCQSVDETLAHQQRWLQSQLPEYQQSTVQTGEKAGA